MISQASNIHELNLDNAYVALSAAIRKRLDEGYKLVFGTFGNPDDGTCCAITAFDPEGVKKEIPGHIWSLMYGFDGEPKHSCKWSEIGESLREEFEPEDFRYKSK